MIFIVYTYIFIVGAVIGSFLNVCIYRVPARMAVWYPPSRCPHCNKRLKPLDMVPIISYLALGGKCRYCGHKITWRYPLIEGLTGMLFILSFSIYGFSAELISAMILISVLIIISFIDIDQGIIPDAFIIIGSLARIIILFVSYTFPWTGALLGVVVSVIMMGTVYFLSWIIFKKEGIGIGDIKLMAMIGLFLGWQRTILALFLAACSGALFGIMLVLSNKRDIRETIPFGPFLSMGALFALFYGSNIIEWYLSLLRQ